MGRHADHGAVQGGGRHDRDDRRGRAHPHGLPVGHGERPRGRAPALRAGHRAGSVAHGGRARSLRHPGRAARRHAGRHQARLPQARPRAPPRRERSPGGRGAVQGGRRRLRDPVGSREAPALRRVRAGGWPRRAAVHRHPGHLRHVLRRRVHLGRRQEQARLADASRRRPSDRRHALVHRGRVRRAQGASARTDGGLRPLSGQRRGAGDGAHRVPHLRRDGSAPADAPEHLRNGDDRRAVPDVRGHRPGGARQVRAVLRRRSPSATRHGGRRRSGRGGRRDGAEGGRRRERRPRRRSVGRPLRWDPRGAVARVRTTWPGSVLRSSTCP